MSSRAILIVLFEIYRYLREQCMRRMLMLKKKAKQQRKPMILKPKSERDCRFCKEAKGKFANPYCVC